MGKAHSLLLALLPDWRKKKSRGRIKFVKVSDSVYAALTCFAVRMATKARSLTWTAGVLWREMKLITVFLLFISEWVRAKSQFYHQTRPLTFWLLYACGYLRQLRDLYRWPKTRAKKLRRGYWRLMSPYSDTPIALPKFVGSVHSLRPVYWPFDFLCSKNSSSTSP